MDDLARVPRMLVVRKHKLSPDVLVVVREGIRLVGAGGRDGKVEAGIGRSTEIVPPGLTIEVDMDRTVILILPVVAAFDKTAFELLCKPKN